MPTQGQRGNFPGEHTAHSILSEYGQLKLPRDVFHTRQMAFQNVSAFFDFDKKNSFFSIAL